MYRLLVVDDEAIITDGLAEILSGLDIPDLTICKAYSGGEALEWLRSARFDIVLSDIRMPELDGLQLLEVIQRDWPRCRVIFLTGYNDFESVYRAIQAPGVRYLLKTEGYAKVIAEVKETIRELDEGLRTDTLLKQAREQRNTLETLAHGDYFRHLLLGGGSGKPDERAEDFRKLQVPLDPALPVTLVSGSLIRTASNRSYADRQEDALAVKLLGDAYLRDKTRCVGIIDRYGDLLWLVQPAKPLPPSDGCGAEAFDGLIRFLEGTLELVQASCLDSLGIETAFTIGGTPFEWAALPNAYDRMRQLQHQRAGDGASMVNTVLPESVEPHGVPRERAYADKLEPLAGLLEAGRSDAFMALLRELAEPLLEDPPADSMQVMELYYAVALMLLAYINRRQLGDQVSAAELMRFEAHASWQEGFDHLARMADRLFELRRSGENSRAEGVIAGICAYIDDHIAEDLSIMRLASRFHFNPSYLSRLFKQGRGQNLSDYIEEARIRMAKAMLAADELRVHEVGARVGYESPHSFTRFFKKAAGMTPQEYREAARARKTAT